MKKKLKTEKAKTKKAKRLITALVCICLCALIYAMSVNFYVIAKEKPNIRTSEELALMNDIDAVLVLGCGINPDNTPSARLDERLKKGREVLDKNKEMKLIVSGDDSGESYNEVAVMKRVSLENGVDEKRIICDSFGFSTYESIYNAKEVFGCKKIIIVTQDYHLSRALYIAEKLGVEAYGADAVLPQNPKRIVWLSREVLARNKDFLKCAFSQ